MERSTTVRYVVEVHNEQNNLSGRFDRFLIKNTGFPVQSSGVTTPRTE